MGTGVLRRRRLAQGLRTSVHGNAQAFGFSITVSFGVVSSRQPGADTWDLLLFAVAGVLAFSLLNVVVVLTSRGKEPSGAQERAVLVGTATDFVAVGAAVGSAAAIVRVVDGRLAWMLVPFLAATIYVLVQSVKLAVGREESGPGS